VLAGLDDGIDNIFTTNSIFASCCGEGFRGEEESRYEDEVLHQVNIVSRVKPNKYIAAEANCGTSDPSIRQESKHHSKQDETDDCCMSHEAEHKRLCLLFCSCAQQGILPSWRVFVCVKSPYLLRPGLYGAARASPGLATGLCGGPFLTFQFNPPGILRSHLTSEASVSGDLDCPLRRLFRSNLT
jgi:hypothetical protein